MKSVKIMYGDNYENTRKIKGGGAIGSKGTKLAKVRGGSRGNAIVVARSRRGIRQVVL